MLTLKRSHPFLLFGLALASVYGTAAYVLHRLPNTPQPDLVAAALTLDLAVLVPLLYYALLVRRRGWPAVSVVPVFLLSLGVASVLMPPAHHQALDLLALLAVPMEVLLLLLVGVQMARTVRRFRAQGKTVDVIERLRQSLRETLGVRWAADVLAFEVGLLYYALGTWRSYPPVADADEAAFSYHRRTGYGALVAGIVVALLMELIALHLLVQLWSTMAAWVLSGLSAYGLLWIVGDLRAVQLRPLVIGRDALIVRIGLRWTVRVPFAVIAEVRPLAGKPPARRTPGYLAAVLMGDPRYLVRLQEPAVAQGLYGIRKTVTTLGLALDDGPAFEAALQARYAAWQAHA